MGMLVRNFTIGYRWGGPIVRAKIGKRLAGAVAGAR